MAKKKQPSPSKQKMPSNPTVETPIAAAETVLQASIPTSDLVGEVQSFLRQRTELAQRLAEEIAITEKRLAELKQTAAMLFPEQTSSRPQLRKAKPVKSKPVNRKEPAGSSPALLADEPESLPAEAAG